MILLIKVNLKKVRFSIKDVTIIDNEIYVSLTKEVKNNCWNIYTFSVIDYNELKFKLFFHQQSVCQKLMMIWNFMPIKLVGNN